VGSVAGAEKEENLSKIKKEGPLSRFKKGRTLKPRRIKILKDKEACGEETDRHRRRKKETSHIRAGFRISGVKEKRTSCTRGRNRYLGKNRKKGEKNSVYRLNLKGKELRLSGGAKERHWSLCLEGRKGGEGLGKGGEAENSSPYCSRQGGGCCGICDKRRKGGNAAVRGRRGHAYRGRRWGKRGKGVPLGSKREREKTPSRRDGIYKRKRMALSRKKRGREGVYEERVEKEKRTTDRKLH